jgi:glutathione S-transferase
MAQEMYRLFGALGSPYSLKMRAVLRYRRIPFVWVQGERAQNLAREEMRAPVIPVLQFPDGELKNDSTPLIYELERRHAERSIVPPDPATAFLAFLIEDFADEWLTKAMFAYRWLRPRDQERMSTWLSFDALHGGGRGRFEARAAQFRERQVGRMALVGCTQENAPLIEETARRVLAALDAHVTDGFFLFGTRPSLAEFGLYGQLSQLGVDPTAADMYRADYPYAFRWLSHMDDLSGIDGDWAASSPVVTQLLRLVGDIYLPFLRANAAALQAGAEEMRFEALGMPFVQAPFKYQLKCLAELRAAYAALPARAQQSLKPLLGDTKCLDALQA